LLATKDIGFKSITFHTFVILMLVLILNLICNLNDNLSVVLLVPLVLIRLLDILE
jgi:hypothetical protein